MRSYLKNGVCLFLSFVLLFPAFGEMTAAANAKAEKAACSGQILTFEEVRGAVVNLFYRFIDLFRKTKDADLPKPAPLPDKTAPAGAIPVVDPSVPAVQTETWRAFEIVFESDKEYADPFSDVTLDLVLIGGGRQYTIPCFWDGGSVWKARAACPSAGTWYYKTVCSDESDAGLQGRTGVIECADYAGDLDVYRHGFPTTGAGEKYFTYADGTPFFYLGDTHWSLGDETADMVREIAAKRASQGFTVWQSEPIGEKFDLTDGVSEADLEGFRAYDEKFEIIAEAGLTHANAEFFYPSGMQSLIEKHGGYADTTVAGVLNGKKTTARELSDAARSYLEALSRYWVARYGAYPVMWMLGQEVDNDFYWGDASHPEWNALNNPYKLVAEYIETYDAYQHPLSAHQEYSGATAAYGNGGGRAEKLTVYNGNAAPSAFRDVSAHTFYAAQWSPSKTGPYDAGVVKDYWYNSQGKPAIDYEGQYCYLWTKNFGARMQGWTAYLNGLYGYGWGGHDTWSYLNTYDENNDSDDGVDRITAEEKQAATWRDSLEYPSSYQVGYMRSFLGDGSWWELIPRFDNKAYFVPARDVYSVFASNRDNSEIVLYFYSFTDPSAAERANTTQKGGIATGTVGNLTPRAEYRYQWFDPIRGEYGGEGTFRASALGTYYLGEKPTDADWAIRITSA
ncbi:MAG: DUF4038 domain-containing protein [Clostridia bacterium]|nr:DUF4038 domain-containing protein [Clostridia bacterium]